MTTLRAAGATDVGRVRSNNQDQFLVDDPLYAVADGMGGHAGGEVASLTAIEVLKDAFAGEASPDGLASAVRAANRAVWEQARERRDLRGMGTTLTAVALVAEAGDELLAIVNVGDSRVYLWRDGQLDQLTDDHSVPEELRRAGRLSPAEAARHPQRNVLTRALGVDPDVEVDCFRVTPYRGDRLVLASDGLFNEVSDAQIARVLRQEGDPEDATAELVELARQGGGNDNITVVVVDVVDDDDRGGRASAALGAAGARVSTGTGAATRTANQPGPVTTSADLGAAAPSVAPTPSATGAAGPTRPPAPPPSSRRRLVTVRLVVFLVALLVILAGAVGTTGWFARAGYYVGDEAGKVVIFKGRPGGLLWFHPTVADRTGVVLDALRPSRRADIREGKQEPSLSAARRYVDNVEKEAAPPPSTTTSLPVPPTASAGLPPASPVSVP